MARALFGGAITAAIPQRFVDVSNFRVIPDNQEVLADIDSDQSIIVELLSLVDDVSNESSAEFHFRELAKENDASDACEIVNIRLLANEELPNLTRQEIYKALLLGRQHVAKFKESAKNVVEIYMAIIRIPSITTDILITFNVPTNVHPQSSSSSNISNTAQQTEPGKIFQEVLRTFKILDWGLFC